MVDYITREEVYNELKDKFFDKTVDQKTTQNSSERKMNFNITIQKSGYSKNKKNISFESRKKTIIKETFQSPNCTKTGKPFVFKI